MSGRGTACNKTNDGQLVERKKACKVMLRDVWKNKCMVGTVRYRI